MKKFALSIFISCSCFAGGYDVNNLWSAKYSAIGGAAVSNVEGAQSLYFNPAGLAQSHNTEWDLNFNTALAQKSAPLTPDGDTKTTPVYYIPVSGLFYSKRMSQKLGLGAGIYAAGGTGAKYEDVNFGSQFTGLKPDVEDATILIELGLGAGYQMNSDVSVGFTWRPTFLSFNSKAAAATDLDADGNPDILLAPEIKNASDLILSGFRLGMKYEPKDKGWGIGATLRSEDDFTAHGKTRGNSELAGSNTADVIQGGNVSITSTLPMRLSLGGHIDSSSQLRLMTEYDYVRNERVGTLKLTGAPLNVNGAGSIPISQLSIPTEWKNQHVFRFGAQYKLPEVWTLRAGYIYSTQVTPNNRASPANTAPSPENSFNIGAGRNIKLFNTPLELDLAIEYLTLNGEGKNSKPGSIDGEYDSQSLSFFTALAYRM